MKPLRTQPILTIQSIVEEVLRSNVLTPFQDQQLKVLIRQPTCTEADVAAVDSLIEALIAGTVNDLSRLAQQAC